MGAGKQHKSNIQLVWGAALVLVGIAVFIKVGHVMPDLEALGPFGGFSRFGLYLMGIILIGGGIRKFISYFRGTDKATPMQKDEDCKD